MQGRDGRASSSSATSSSCAWSGRRITRPGTAKIIQNPLSREPFSALNGSKWLVNGQEQQLKLAISRAQVDCQLPGRCDAKTARSDATLGGPNQDRPAVVFANRGQGDRAFLSLQIKRCVSSSGRGPRGF